MENSSRCTAQRVEDLSTVRAGVVSDGRSCVPGGLRIAVVGNIRWIARDEIEPCLSEHPVPRPDERPQFGAAADRVHPGASDRMSRDIDRDNALRACLGRGDRDDATAGAQIGDSPT